MLKRFICSVMIFSLPATVAHASALDALMNVPLLNNTLLNKVKNKVTTQVSITVAVDNSALWDKPMPYYLALFKVDGTEKMIESYMLDLDADPLQKNALRPLTHDKTQTIFEHNSTVYPGDYVWILDRKPIYDASVMPSKTEWTLPKVQYFSIDAKPVDRHISFALKGFPTIQDKTENAQPAEIINAEPIPTVSEELKEAPAPQTSEPSATSEAAPIKIEAPTTPPAAE